jgi:hypothetical protein
MDGSRRGGVEADEVERLGVGRLRDAGMFEDGGVIYKL